MARKRRIPLTRAQEYSDRMSLRVHRSGLTPATIGQLNKSNPSESRCANRAALRTPLSVRRQWPRAEVAWLESTQHVGCDLIVCDAPVAVHDRLTKRCPKNGAVGRQRTGAVRRRLDYHFRYCLIGAYAPLSLRHLCQPKRLRIPLSVFPLSNLQMSGRACARGSQEISPSGSPPSDVSAQYWSRKTSA